MSESEQSFDTQFWSAFSLGELLIVAGIVSVGYYRWTGSWPAEYGGWVAGIFTISGITLTGYSRVQRSYDGHVGRNHNRDT